MLNSITSLYTFYFLDKSTIREVQKCNNSNVLSSKTFCINEKNAYAVKRFSNFALSATMLTNDTTLVWFLSIFVTFASLLNIF